MAIRRLDYECNPTTLRDGRGGIFTYYPEDPIVEWNLLFTKAGESRGFHYHKEFDEYVLITSGRGTVRMLGDDQISGTIAFGHRGGTLDLYGHDLSRNVIYAMDGGAQLTNTAANTTSTLTWTGSGRKWTPDTRCP